jgi:transcriptional regulator with XRE-family HTH domain
MYLLGKTMNLREYLFIRRMSVKSFSEIVDYSRTHISSIVNGRLIPSPKLARRIEKETNGEVKAEELLRGDGLCNGIKFGQ